MKKILFAIIGLLLMGSELAYAQYPVFSSSLAGGAGGVYTRRGVRRSVYRPGGYAGYTGYGYDGNAIGETYSLLSGTASPTVIVKPIKYILRYSKNKVEVTKKEMEKLKPIIQHLKDRKIKSLEIIGIDRDPDLSQSRYAKIVEIFTAYHPDIQINYRSISGVAVLETNNHTIEIIEHY